ncbi:MAG: hypothetical protein HF312_03755 [Ignavibacteria bacterium]|jgi:capsule polysaccharide export protein KpsE/RkpR|nr:hypothetical protein [Ignavibacteria bacterium]MCU7519304.1 hypothetical protein [Ignavibacteria bacterium]
MAENRGFDILDYIVLVVKWKKFLLLTFISVLVLSYLVVYYFIPAEYDSTALIIPAGNEGSPGSMAGVMKNLKDLPFGMGGTSKSAETDLYVTIIYSRSTLEKLVHKFNLQKDYKLMSMEETLKQLRTNIDAGTTKENAFAITVKANSAQKAADMVNYLLSLLNESVINLNVAKSKNNREFLEVRYREIKGNLKNAEDSLQYYQQVSGMLEAKEQSKMILDAYSRMEGEVTAKQLELSIMEKVTSSDSPQLKLLKTQLDEYKSELVKMQRSGENGNFLLSINSLPEKTKKFLRLYRNVEIYNGLLEFIVPIFEQAKFEEQKNVPVLQVIDYGSVAEKKSYPPRTLFAVLGGLFVTVLLVIVLILREALRNSSNQKVAFILQELKFKRK